MLANRPAADRKLPKQAVISIWFLEVEKMIHCIGCAIGQDCSRVNLEAIR
jgi:hypothetical protein